MEKERNFIDTNKNQMDVLKKLQQEYHDLVDEDDRNMHFEIDEINKYNQEIQHNEIEISFLEQVLSMIYSDKEIELIMQKVSKDENEDYILPFFYFHLENT